MLTPLLPLYCCLQSVGDEALSRIFRAFPGMEYCDLKKDRLSGRSKGYCYVSYAAPESAAAAQAQLNGVEFPPGSGYKLKVGLMVYVRRGGGGIQARRTAWRSHSQI